MITQQMMKFNTVTVLHPHWRKLCRECQERKVFNLRNHFLELDILLESLFTFNTVLSLSRIIYACISNKLRRGSFYNLSLRSISGGLLAQVTTCHAELHHALQLIPCVFE